MTTSTGTQPVDVLLIGLGSIGTVYAYLLEKSGKARVTAVARSNYPLYAGSGVTLETTRFGTICDWKPYRVFKSQSEAFADGTKYALCVVATKSLPDVLPTPTLLADAVKSNQVGGFVLIQNGLGVEADLAAVTDVPIISCLAWIAVNNTATGDVVTWRGTDKLGAGIYPTPSPEKPSTPAADAALKLWAELLTAGEANVVVTDNIESMRFAKNVWTCTWACLQGLMRTPAFNFAPLSEQHHVQVKKYMREIYTVGYTSKLLFPGLMLQPMNVPAQGIEESIEQDFERFILNPPVATRGHKWSLLLDVENSRPFEVEVIIGTVVALARQYNIDTPLLDFTYTVLKGIQQSILEKKAAASDKAQSSSL